MTCQVNELASQAAVVAQTVTMDFHIHIPVTEEPDQVLGSKQSGGSIIRKQGLAQRAAAVSGEGDEMISNCGEVMSFTGK